MAKRLDGKVAIVTGAARGLGQTFSVGLAEHGARVVAADIMDVSATLSAIESVNGTGIGAKANVADRSDVERMVQQAIDAYGRVDILVNNAGLMPMQPIDEISLEDWHRTLGVNLDGPFLCIKAVLPQMKKQHYGKVVTISSNTFLMGVPNMSHYVATKGGLIGLTRSLAAEVGDFGITVNCIAPGATKTPGLEAIPAVLEIWDDVLVAAQCIKRRQVPEDLLGPLLFLASDDSAFVTGQTLCVDGGWARH